MKFLATPLVACSLYDGRPTLDQQALNPVRPVGQIATNSVNSQRLLSTSLAMSVSGCRAPHSPLEIAHGSLRSDNLYCDRTVPRKVSPIGEGVGLILPQPVTKSAVY